MPQFQLITLNCYGVLAPQTGPRLLTLAQELNRCAVDVVCLQEVQAQVYRRLLIHACYQHYPASAYAPYIHAPKGGLLTLATAMIGDPRFTLYRERGLWYTPAVMDWILHKGILQTRLSVGGVPITVLNTHLTANYTGNWKRSNPYARQEWAQLRQLAEVVLAEPADSLVIVAGDFNVPRGSWLEDDYLKLSGLSDPLYGDQRPTLHPPAALPARFAAPIDYALVRAPNLPNLQISCEYCFDQVVTLRNGQRSRLSDHDALRLTVTWGDGPPIVPENVLVKTDI